MRIGYCGHLHHRITGSSRFLLDELRGVGDVEEHWMAERDEPPEPLLHGEYDAVVVWQLERVALRLAEAGHANVTFFPMYDSCHAYPDSYWRRLRGVKVVSFSSTLHARLQRLAVPVRLARYFPELPPEQAREEVELAGYFWERRQGITWSTIRALVGSAPFRRFTIHDAPDPAAMPPVPPSPDEVLRLHLRTTHWFPSRAEARADLLAHNVYFAPRLREGIGMSFLEAMAMGFLVVAPDQPTMSEYLTSGVNGVLYDPDRPVPLDFGRHREMGRRARRSIEVGRERWLRTVPALLEFLAAPTRHVPVTAPFDALDPLACGRGRVTRPSDGPQRAQLSARLAGDAVPLVSIALAGAPSDASTWRATLDTVLAQDWPRVELLVPARGAELLPGDGSIERASTLPALEGPALRNAAADVAHGDFLLLLAPGDLLPTQDTLSRALRDAPPGADLLVADHLRRDPRGRETHARAADPALAYAGLQRGEVDWRWIESIPAGAAVLWRAAFVRRLRFRADLALWSEEALLRAVGQGAQVHHTLARLASCPDPPRRVRDRRRLLAAWFSVASPHTHHPDALARGFHRMRATAATRELHGLPWVDLLRSIPSVPGAFKEMKRRLRARQPRPTPAPGRAGG